jgi:hypothetical protein
MSPKDIQSPADVARWLQHYVEWNDIASSDMRDKAVDVLHRAFHGETWPDEAKRMAKECVHADQACQLVRYINDAVNADAAWKSRPPVTPEKTKT